MAFTMTVRTPVLTAALAVTLLMSFSACDAAVDEESLLDAVRQATEQFKSPAAALAAGYEPGEHCVAHPAFGGQGYHWTHPRLVDASFEPLRPEVLLYAPAGEGLRLVAVKYVVLDVGQRRPDFEGRLLDEGGSPPLMEAGVPHWSLFLWVFEENPLGVFATHNPNVRCG